VKESGQNDERIASQNERHGLNVGCCNRAGARTRSMVKHALASEVFNLRLEKSRGRRRRGYEDEEGG